ncbi:tetratricopeptide repeat protein [Alphaproteobacteria bacterium]|nr:tetratricopeptide repeat protein [Alphaproteobacteria bacterium]
MELTIEQALQQGVAAHKEGKLQDAERLYRAILQSQPLHPDANHNLAVIAVSVNKAEAALPLFKAALEANPKIEQFWLSYIDVLIKTEKVDDARRVLADAQQAGVTPAKLQIFEEQLEFELSSSIHIPQQEIRNSLHSHQGELSPAFELREIGRYKEAQEWLSNVIEHDSRNAEALSLLSQVLLLDKKELEAEKALTAAASINSELPSVYRNQARLLLKQSKTAEALEKAQLGCRQSPEDSESLLVLAACLGANQRDLEALPLIEKILKAKSNYAEAYANRALIKLRAKDTTGAIEDAEMTVSLKPHLTQMWQLLSSLHYQANNLSDAIEALRRAHKNEPDNPNFMIQLGEFLRQDNKASEAITILEQATELAPKDANAWTNLGVAFQQEKRITDAKIAYETALTLNPKSAAIASNLGAMAKEAEEWESALQYFGKALEIGPDYAEAHNNLGNMLHELGRLGEAEASYTQAIALKPDYAEAHSNLGVTLQKLGRLDEAEASYTQAIALKSDFAEAHSNLGNTLKELGRLDESEASSLQAIALEPDFAKAHNSLLSCFYLLDKQSLFFDKLDYLIKKDTVNATIGSLTCRSALKYGVQKPNLFCGEPLKYVLHIDMNLQYDFEEIFVEKARLILNENKVSNRKQALLVNGYQTFGNLFDIENSFTEQIQKAIRLEIEKYRINFKDSKDGLIKKWPTEYSLYGWLISMKSGGKLKPHIHDMGWLSGSLYINVPPKSKAESGNLVVSLGEEKDATDTRINVEKTINVVTGSLVLFPASLTHYTIPFEAQEERIVLGFDVRKK